MNSVIRKRGLLTASAFIVATGISACGEPVEKMLVEETTLVVENAGAMPQASVAELISQAETRYAEAASLSHAWTTTRTLIDQASATRQAGDDDKARELAEHALATAVASVDQANLEVDAWQSRVPQ